MGGATLPGSPRDGGQTSSLRPWSRVHPPLSSTRGVGTLFGMKFRTTREKPLSALGWLCKEEWLPRDPSKPGEDVVCVQCKRLAKNKAHAQRQRERRQAIVVQWTHSQKSNLRLWREGAASQRTGCRPGTEGKSGRYTQYNGGGGDLSRGQYRYGDLSQYLERRVTTTLSLTEISTKHRYYTCTLS